MDFKAWSNDELYFRLNAIDKGSSKSIDELVKKWSTTFRKDFPAEINKEWAERLFTQRISLYKGPVISKQTGASIAGFDNPKAITQFLNKGHISLAKFMPLFLVAIERGHEPPDKYQWFAWPNIRAIREISQHDPYCSDACTVKLDRYTYDWLPSCHDYYEARARIDNGSSSLHSMQQSCSLKSKKISKNGYLYSLESGNKTQINKLERSPEAIDAFYHYWTPSYIVWMTEYKEIVEDES